MTAAAATEAGVAEAAVAAEAITEILIAAAKKVNHCAKSE